MLRPYTRTGAMAGVVQLGIHGSDSASENRSNMIRIVLRRFRLGFALMLVLFAPQTLAQSNDLDAILGALEDPYPLRAADTSSPRDTLRTFLRDIDTFVEAWQSDKPRAEIVRPLLRAADTIDFGDIRAVDRPAELTIKMILLKEILDRVELPSFEDIPDDKEVAQKGIGRWTIPNTKIEIAKTTEGSNAGEFLFTKETVDNLDSYYALSKDIPYKKGAYVNLYEEVIYSPGVWLPKDLSKRFPTWANIIVFGQGLWQWISLFLITIISAIFIWFAYRLGAHWDDKHRISHPSVRFGVPVALLGSFVIAHFVELTSYNGIGLFETPYAVVSLITLVVKVVSLGLFVVVLAGRLADGVAFSQAGSLQKRRVDAALLRIVFRLVSVVVLAYLGIYAAEAVGIPIAPLVAGLGVGGLAIALAIRPTLENIIGGLTLFADRPVRVGDFCRYGDEIGTVEQIGLRSTRIRTLERTIVTVPNAEFSQMKLDNFAVRDLRLLNTTLGLRYETTPDQLRYVLAELRKLLLGHPKVTPAPARVRFVGYGAYSLDLEIFAYLRCQDQDAFLAIQEDIFLRIAEIVTEAGTGFAFPSQTTYFRRDGGVDAERGREAEAKVEDWREHDRLPFPEFDPALRPKMEDTLDYPPMGAYDYKPR
jgi:MscS family membrane protein